MFIPENLKVDVMNTLFASLQKKWEKAHHVKKPEFAEMMVMHDDALQPASTGFDLEEWQEQNAEQKETAGEEELEVQPHLEVKPAKPKEPKELKEPKEPKEPTEPKKEEKPQEKPQELPERKEKDEAELPAFPPITLDTLSPQSIFSLFTNEEPQPVAMNPILSQAPLSPHHQFNSPPTGDLPFYSFNNLLLPKEDNQASPMSLQIPSFQDSGNVPPYGMYNYSHNHDMYGINNHVGISPNPTNAMQSGFDSMIGHYEETSYAAQPTLMELLQQSSIEKEEKVPERTPVKEKEPEVKETKTEEKKLQKATRKPSLRPSMMRFVKKTKYRVCCDTH